jgi:hypothetical protein
MNLEGILIVSHWFNHRLGALMKNFIKSAMTAGALTRIYKHADQAGDVQLCHFHH